MSVTTGLVYVERRLNFAINMAKNLEEKICDIDGQLGNDAQRMRASKHLREKLGNSIGFFENQLHQVACLQKRSASFFDTVSVSNIRYGQFCKTLESLVIFSSRFDQS
jgi:hypothetical protein